MSDENHISDEPSTGPAMPADDLISKTDAIRGKYPHWRRDETAQQELRALWGDAINESGVFVEPVDEMLYERGYCYAEISIGHAHGLYTFGCRYFTTNEGRSFAPSISCPMFVSRDLARTAAIEDLLASIPEREEFKQMRETLQGILAQPTLL